MGEDKKPPSRMAQARQGLGGCCAHEGQLPWVPIVSTTAALQSSGVLRGDTERVRLCPASSMDLSPLEKMSFESRSKKFSTIGSIQTLKKENIFLKNS